MLVIGAGQAGLAVGWHLREQGVRSFLLLDAGPEVGHVWRNRWDSLRLFTPAEYDALPGMPFPAPAGTYPTKDQVADYLRGYAAAFELPVRLNTRVTRLSKTGDTFVADTSTGTVTARQVVIATGPFQTPVIPRMAAGLAADVVQVHSADYRNPDQLPDGTVLVVGAGNSGLQIAAELAATRPVTVAVGTRPPMLPQRFLGRDLFWWLTRLGLITKTADSRLARRLRKKGDLVIGTRWRDLARLGIQVRPRLDDVDLTTAMFADGSVTMSRPSSGPPGSAPTTRGSTSPAPSSTTRSRTSAASPPSRGSASWGCRGCTPAAPPCSGTSMTTPPGSPTTSATSSRPRAPRPPQATCPSDTAGTRMAVVRVTAQCYARSSWASSPREVTPALVKMFRRWKATVRGDTQHWAAMSLFDMPWRTRPATWRSIGVSISWVDGSRLRAVSPDARSSWLARAASGSARRSSNVSSAARRWVRASTRR